MLNFGNDIIDLKHTRHTTNWQRPGFLDKQFTATEQHYIFKSNHSFNTIWLFWSMKEAAYKCLVQHTKHRFFAPKKFNCKITGKNTGVVFYNSATFFIKWTLNKAFIHTIASTKELVKTTYFYNISAKDHLQTAIKYKLARAFNVPMCAIIKHKSAIGVPNYYYNNKPLTASCSLSHHGNFGGFIFSLEYGY